MQKFSNHILDNEHVHGVHKVYEGSSHCRIWIMSLFPFKYQRTCIPTWNTTKHFNVWLKKKFRQLYPFTKVSITVSTIILIMTDRVRIKYVNLFNNKKGGITSKLSANMYIYIFVFNNAISLSGKRRNSQGNSEPEFPGNEHMYTRSRSQKVH